MAEELKVGCGRPTGGPVGEEFESTNTQEQQPVKKEVSPMLKIGKKAPDFVAPGYYNGEFTSIKLSDFLGKWVVLCFYPGDFTFVCGTELSAVASKYDEFQKLGVEVLSMSIDSIYTHKVWNDNELSKMVEGGIPFRMLSDAGGKIGAAYGVYDEEGGVDTRGRFIIDPDGVLQVFEVLTPPVGRNVNEALRQIRAYQYVRENPAEVTPSGWTPGKPTLTPRPELVGNVWKAWNTDLAFK